MVKDHSYSKRGNLLLPHGLLFPISSKGSFICIIPQTGWHIPWPLLHQSLCTGWNEKLYASSLRQDNTYHSLLHQSWSTWLQQETAQWVNHEGLIWRPITPWANALTTELRTWVEVFILSTTSRTCFASVDVMPPTTYRMSRGWSLGRGLLTFMNSLQTNTYTWKHYLKEQEMFYLTMHSTHFIYGYMVSDIWLTTILIVREETRCCHMGYSFWLTARVLLYALSHIQDSTYHGLCYTSRGALAGTRNSSMGPLSDSEKGNPLPPHGLLFPIKQQDFFYIHYPTDRIAHTMAIVTPVVEYWLEWEIANGSTP